MNMKILSTLLLLILSTAYAAETISTPLHPGDPTNILMGNGKIYPLSIIYGTNGSGGFSPVSGGGGGGGTVAQGAPGPVASPWPVALVSPLPLPVTATSWPLPTGAAQDGTDGAGITAPTGGVGIRGWLSGIYKLLGNTLSVTVGNFPSSQNVVVTALPSPVPVTQGAPGPVASPWPVVIESATSSVGHGVLSNFTQNYSTNLSTSAFTTIITSTASVINAVDIFDSSGLDFYLAYASSCGSLSSSSNAVIISPGGGEKDFQIPSGQCVGFEAKTSTISSGYVNMTFYK